MRTNWEEQEATQKKIVPLKFEFGHTKDVALWKDKHQLKKRD